MDLEIKEKPLIEKYNDLLLDIGSTLMVSGANCGRIDRNVKRIADVLGVDIEAFYSYSGLMLTTTLKENRTEKTTHYKKLHTHGVHFGVLSEVSLLSWRAVNESMPYEQIKSEFETIKKIPHHSRFKILIFVAFACASLCFLFEGNYINALFAFAGSFLGLFVRQELVKKKFNIMIAIIMASFITSFVSSVGIYFKLGTDPIKALASSVLYLVPGVPMINAIIDFIEGYIVTGISRGFFTGFILMCVAIGMTLCILLFGIKNFN